MPSKQALIDYLKNKKEISLTVEEVNIIINKLSSMEEPAEDIKEEDEPKEDEPKEDEPKSS